MNKSNVLTFAFFFCSSVLSDCVQAHLRSTELENTKLSAELQMLKAVELNREVTIAQFQEELERLRACVAQRDSLEKELLANKADKVVVHCTHMLYIKISPPYLHFFSPRIFRQSWHVCVNTSVRRRSSSRRLGSKPPSWPLSSATQPAPATTR